jgi:phosphate transport system substrate-binding protein
MGVRCFILLVGLATLSGCGPSGGTSGRIDGAGSTFVEPMMQEWSAKYKEAKGVSVSYQGKGSTAGIKGMTARDVNFGCSDAPMTEEQLKEARDQNGEVIHVPLCMGAIAIAYNLPECPDLVLDGPTLIGIFTRRITTWDHDDIKALNKDLAGKLPPDKISVARRDDGSGSTYILSDYLSKIDPDKKEWKAGRGTSLKWHKDTVGCKGTGAVAKQISGTRGTVGYIELLYALDKKLPVARVKNRAGNDIKPEMKSVAAAAADADIPDNLCFSITDAKGKEAYPIAGAVYAVTYVKPPKGQAVKDFLWWATHDGQKYTEALHYVALPAHLVKKIEAKLELIK